MSRTKSLFILMGLLIPWSLSAQLEIRKARAYKNFYDYKAAKVLFDTTFSSY